MTDYDAPLPPQDLQAEEAVLGACLLSGNAIDATADVIGPEDYYLSSNGSLFRAVLELHAQGDPVDAVTLTAHVGKDRKQRVYELAAQATDSTRATHYARIVKACATRRALITVGAELIREGHGDGDVDKAEQLVYEIANKAGTEFDLDPDARGYIGTLQRLRDNPGLLIGVPSGFQALDEITQGFVPGNLIVVGARPSMGKSALALCITANLLGRDEAVGLVTLEMSKPEIMQRLVSIGANLPGEKLRNPRKLSEDEWTRAKDAADRLASKPLYVREAGVLTPMEVRAQIRRLKAKVPNLALVIVDYLQLMTAPGKDGRTQEVSEISRALKATARDLDVPVMALSQLNRSLEQRTDKRPILSDLRESGSIEQDADLVIFLYRDDYYNEPEMPLRETWVEVNVAKHRNGPTDRVKLVFVKEQARFSNPTPRLVDVGRAA